MTNETASRQVGGKGVEDTLRRLSEIDVADDCGNHPPGQSQTLGDFFKSRKGKPRIRVKDTSAEVTRKEPYADHVAEKLIEPLPFEVTVMMMSGETVTISDLRLADTVGCLRGKVAQHLGWEFTDVQLIFNSHILKLDSRSLSLVGLHHGADIFVARVRWQHLLVTVVSNFFHDVVLQGYDLVSGEWLGGSVLADEGHANTCGIEFVGEEHLVLFGAFAPDVYVIVLCLNTLEYSSLLRGHTSAVNAAVAVPRCDGNLVTASQDCTARLWNIDNGTLLQTYHGHEEHVTCVQVYSAGAVQYLITGSEDKTVREWELESGQQRRSFSHPTRIESLHLLGKLVAVGGTCGEVWLRNLTTGKYRAGSMEFEYGVFSHSSDGGGAEGKISAVLLSEKLLFTGSHSGKLCFWDISSGRNIITDRPEDPTVLHPIRDLFLHGHLLFVVQADSLRVWDVNTRQQILQEDALPESSFNVSKVFEMNQKKVIAAASCRRSSPFHIVPS